MNMATAVGLSKVFILDKYFTELQKFWETERKLQGNLLSIMSTMSTYVIRVFVASVCVSVCEKQVVSLVYLWE